MNKNKEYIYITRTMKINVPAIYCQDAIDKIELMKKKKTKWDKLPIMCWSLTLYKEDDKGNQKFYEYTGDHSFVAEGMENEYLSEIDGEDA